MSTSDPFGDSTPFGFIGLKGGAAPTNYQLPGILKKIDGAETPDEWAFQKGTATSGATSVFRGAKLAESIKFTIVLMNSAQWTAALAAILILRPKRGTKPPTFNVVNPCINTFSSITRIFCKFPGFPEWDERANKWTWTPEFGEYGPSKVANVGPNTGAFNAGDFDPNNAAKARLTELLNQASTLTTQAFPTTPTLTGK